MIAAPALYSGDNLRSAIEDGPAYATYLLDRDFTHEGDYEFTKPVVLRSLQLFNLPPGRVTPDLVGPTLKGQFIATAPGVVWEGLRVEGTNRDRNLVEVYGAHLEVDRCYVTGVVGGQRRAFYLAATASFVNSHIDNIVYQGNGDTQAIGAERDAHDVVIENCYLGAAGEVVMVGGGDIGTQAQMCRNWMITDCTLAKQLQWRGLGGVAKNLFELKAIKGCTVRRTEMRHSWADAQIGFAIVLTPRNQNGLDTFATIEDVLFEDVVVNGCAGGISLLGRDDTYISERMTNVTFRRVQIKDLSRHSWGGGINGRTVQILGGPKNLVFDGFTVEAGPSHRSVDPDDGPAVTSALLFDVRGDERCDGFVMRDARLEEGCYGVMASGDVSVPGGLPALNTAAPGFQWQSVVMKTGGVRTFTYPVGTVVL
jgi:hypothetical protein